MGAPAVRLPLGLLLLPVASTLLGGWIALRGRRYLPFLMAMGAGLLLGTALLDLFPEALALARESGRSAGFVAAVTLLTFAVFLGIGRALDRVGRRRNGRMGTRALGRISGGLLIVHSLRDGMVIGAAYAASRTAGLMVAVGIVAHDIGDGMNTVLLSTGGETAGGWDYLLLAGDALAPLVGGLLTIWWVQTPANAVVLLAVASGFFLQMAASDFLPELGRQARTRWGVIPAFAAGLGLIWVANLLLAGMER